MVFDGIPEEFDKWRPRYCEELFEDLIEYAALGPGKSALEIGPGTGQATEPILKTGCDYLAIELGEHLATYTKDRFRGYANFRIVNADFETYDFGRNRFDLVMSAAAIQWIPEEIGFPKVYDILRSGGTLAMMMTHTDYKTPDEALYDQIQAVYDQYFRPETPYTCCLEYGNAVNHGFVDFDRREYHGTRVYDADGYVSLIGTHADHITLREPHRSKFFAGIREAIQSRGNRIMLNDTIILYLTRKP
jgi:SAM-dependent methyltransferase